MRLWSQLLTSLELVRLHEPVVPWRRVTQRLVWKECRQAWPFAKIIGMIAFIAMIVPVTVPALRLVGVYVPLIAVMATPLVIGVGSYYVEQSGHAYRMLGDRGATADGGWIIKHATWLLHAMVICGVILWADDVFSQHRGDTAFGVRPSIMEAIRHAVGPPAYLHPYQLNVDLELINLKAIEFALFYIVVAYSIAQRFSFSFAKGPLAFGMATGAMTAAGLIWFIFASRDIPIRWTIGAIPIALLAYTCAHSAKWHVHKIRAESWPLTIAWFLLPFAGIAVGVYVYWPQLTLAVWRYSSRVRSF
jgi:hypothetical protein